MRQRPGLARLEGPGCRREHPARTSPDARPGLPPGIDRAPRPARPCLPARGGARARLRRRGSLRRRESRRCRRSPPRTTRIRRPRRCGRQRHGLRCERPRRSRRRRRSEPSGGSAPEPGWSGGARRRRAPAPCPPGICVSRLDDCCAARAGARVRAANIARADAPRHLQSESIRRASPSVRPSTTGAVLSARARA
jgi:hypothetical protein